MVVHGKESKPSPSLKLVNAMDGHVLNAYFAGYHGRGIMRVGLDSHVALLASQVLSVACGLRWGTQTELQAGRAGDVFIFAASGETCVPGRAVAQPDKPLGWWSHDRNGRATVIVLDEHDVVGIWEDEEEDALELAWREGLRWLFGADDEGARASAPSTRMARRYLTSAAILGDLTAGAVLSLAVSAGVLEGNEGGALKRYGASWLAKLALGTRAAPDSAGCRTSVAWLLTLLRDLAAFGAGSPEDAVSRPRHAVGSPIELLVDHWMLASGYRTLRDDLDREDISLLPASEATSLYNRARAGDSLAATELAEGLLEGRYAAGDDVLRGLTPEAVAAELYDMTHDDPDSEAALAELLLGGVQGIAPDPKRALALVSTRHASAHGLQVRAHLLLDVVQDRAKAMRAFEQAIQAGSPDAKVSLGHLLLQHENASRGATLLRSALHDDSSLTAGLMLAEHLWSNSSNRSTARCFETRNVLLDAVRHTNWDAGSFGTRAALARASALWELDKGQEQRRCVPVSNTPNGSLLLELRSLKPCTPPATARAAGAYRMFAVLGTAGVVAADINAGFAATRLYRYTGDETFSNVAQRHYERVLAGPGPNRIDPDAPLLPRLKALERAEAARALGSLRRAVDLGSEWAAVELAMNAVKEGQLHKARRIASRCADSTDWPQTAPCDLLAFSLRLLSPFARFLFSKLRGHESCPEVDLPHSPFRRQSDLGLSGCKSTDPANTAEFHNRRRHQQQQQETPAPQDTRGMRARWHRRPNNADEEL